jgi:hypothetical protein
VGSHAKHFDTLLLKASEQPSKRMKFGIGGYEFRSGGQRQRRKKSNQNVVGTGTEAVSAGWIVQQAPISGAYLFRLTEGVFPLLIDVLSRVHPSLTMAVKATVGPCLMGVSGKKGSIAYLEPLIVIGQLVGISSQGFDCKGAGR